ncbi:MAG: hypothetical protein M0D55_12470 [Elusimicrobiota bacterium]|nr:MAG: hypothetical protein M0D55_12470 [Elusimicrobiota bacterium]
MRGAGKVVALSDGPAALAAPLLAAASKDGLGVVAFGDALWASGSGAYGPVRVAADLRPTEGGGSVSISTERGDDELARELDALGFRVVREGRGLSARLDAETSSADARDIATLAADGAALATGGLRSASPSSEGLERLLADVKSSPAKAEKAAAALDGRSTLSRARTVAWVGELEAVAADIPSRGERVLALRDPATGLPKYARVEPIRTR